MEVFSGNLLTEVLRHFETKFAEGSESDDVENSIMENSARACVAILNCAGKLDASKIDGMQAHVVGQLSAARDMAAEGPLRANLSPNVALLCAWGMTNDIALCLSKSISQFFNEQNRSFAQKSGTPKKRKANRKSQAATDISELSHLDLDVDVCLGILGHILKGSYPASRLARTSILNSEAAFNAITSALQMAKSAAERLVEPGKVRAHTGSSVVYFIFQADYCLHFRLKQIQKICLGSPNPWKVTDDY